MTLLFSSFSLVPFNTSPQKLRKTENDGLEYLFEDVSQTRVSLY
jgi:hypothetical protein